MAGYHTHLTAKNCIAAMPSFGLLTRSPSAGARPGGRPPWRGGLGRESAPHPAPPGSAPSAAQLPGPAPVSSGIRVGKVQRGAVQKSSHCCTKVVLLLHKSATLQVNNSNCLATQQNSTCYLLQLRVAGDQQEVELKVSPQRPPAVVAAAHRSDSWSRPAG